MTEKEINSSCETFSKYRPFFLAQLEDLSETLEGLFQNNPLFDLKIEGRVKKNGSFKKKLEKKQDKYSSAFEDMTDIIGIRLITMYKDQNDDIVDTLRENFIVDLKNSSNKFKMLDYDKMGYISLHYVCSYKHPEKDLYPELLEILDNLKFEIQIRTTLQHVWAEIDHKLRYKTLVDVPDKIKRKLFRLSALFEMADSDFCHIRDEVRTLERFYEKKFSAKRYNLHLNLSTINFYLKYNDKQIAEILKIMHIQHFKTFDVAKEEKLEKKLLQYATKFSLTEVTQIDKLIHCILSNQGVFLTYVDTEMRTKLSYGVNSSCTFILNLLLMVFEERDILGSIYNISESSLDSLMELRDHLDLDFL